MEIKGNMVGKIKKTWMAISIALLVSVISLCYYLITHDEGDRPAQYSIAKEGGQPSVIENDSFSDSIVNQLKKYYGKTISEKSTQANLIGIRDFIMSSQPVDGKALFYAILKRAFPDYADEIMATLDKLDHYNRWLADNHKMLSHMTAAERAAALSEKRSELFGDDADKIWTGDMLASDARKAKVKDTLAILNKSDNTTIDKKIEMFQGALHDAYKDSPEQFIMEQNHLMAKVFFSIESVQDELKKMNPEQRQWEMNNIRRKMGFPEEQIEEMGKRDADREQRWGNGLNYMQEREDIVKKFEGSEREERLNTLREKYFQDEAKSIELEEKDDFFRFKRPRIYGRN
jgi:hypothetical protein